MRHQSPSFHSQSLSEKLQLSAMADSQSSRIINPWVLHLQKLGLELKCPSCLELYNRPVLLPCNHIFCESCVPDLSPEGSDCAVCKQSHISKDVRQAPFMENVVNIYRNLHASFSHEMQQMSFVKGGRSSLTPCSLNKSKQSVQVEAVEMDTNQSNPLSQGYGANSSGHGSGSGDDSQERNTAKKSSKRAADELTSNEVHSSTSKLADNCSKMVKKTKQESNVSGDSISKVSADPGAMNMSSPQFICGFCQTWKETEYSGPMLHYANGKPVVGKEATGSNVVHVHSKCIEWAPQIYYVGETVKNLNKEMQRGAKLKCSQCKLKGAALGCYAKSCKRSYHVPCAAEIPECRWDTDNFLMFCPAHTSFKFPGEKSRKQSSLKEIKPEVPAQRSAVSEKPKELDFWAASPSGAQNWVFCGSSLSFDDKAMLIKFATLCGATVMRSWTPDVTHVIAATDETGACSRTRKVLMAILKGKWVLKVDWIKACMEKNGPVDEEVYEVGLDNHGCHDGPRLGRLRALSNAPKLFTGLHFHFTGEFVRTYKEDLEDLILSAGGALLQSKEQLRQQGSSAAESGQSATTCLVVFNSDASLDTGGSSDVLHRQLDAEVLAAETWSQAVPHTWLLDSIASCGLQPFAQ